MDIKQTIQDYEYYQNGFHKLCGNEVRVVNLKVKKDKVVADVILYEMESGNSQRYNDCEYSKDLLKKYEKMHTSKTI